MAEAWGNTVAPVGNAPLSPISAARDSATQDKPKDDAKMGWNTGTWLGQDRMICNNILPSFQIVTRLTFYLEFDRSFYLKSLHKHCQI